MRLSMIGPALAAVVCAAGPARGSGDVLPLTLATYATSADAARHVIARSSAVNDAVLQYSQADVASPATQSYLPVLYSALIPGLGEFTMGYRKRGIALMALEVVAWTGYFVKHEDGMEARDEYEAFADAHWNMDKWILDHPCNVEQYGDGSRTLENLELCGESSSGSGDWPGYIPWVSKEDDKQHYYENIGKYDWYISGWSDWDAALDPYLEDTDLRTQYREMRAESNDALDDANAFIWVSVATRAFSIVQSAILVSNRRDDAAAGDGSMALRATPRGFTGGQIALEVNFR